MSIVLAIVLLAVVLLAALLMVPLGLPGLWVMLGAALLYNVLLPLGGIGWVTLGVCGVLTVVAEVLEFTLGSRYARKYGGSRRASWGSIVGGLVGALVGVPVPVIGSVIGAFAGAFAGALIGEFTVARQLRGDPARVATGAVVGRAVAAAIKTGIGVVIMVWILAAAIFGHSTAASTTATPPTSARLTSVPPSLGRPALATTTLETTTVATATAAPHASAPTTLSQLPV